MDGPHEEPITLDESDLDIDKGNDSRHMLRPKQQVDLLGFSVNLAISTLGGGLLSLPFVFNVTGYAFGAVLLLLFAAISSYSMWILISCVPLAIKSRRLLFLEERGEVDGITSEFVRNVKRQPTPKPRRKIKVSATDSYNTDSGDMNVAVLGENQGDHTSVLELEDGERADEEDDSNEEMEKYYRKTESHIQYEDIGYSALGTPGYVTVSVGTIFLNFGAATGFLVIAGDLIKSLVDWLQFEGTAIDNRWLNVTIMTTVIVLPLCFVKRFADLRWISMLSMVSNFVLAAMCVAYLLTNGGVSFDQLQAVSINKGIFLVMPVLAFGFAGHTNLLPAYNEMKTEVKTKINWGIIGCIGMVLVTFLALGEIGYITFGSKTLGNVLNNYPNDQAFINVIRILLLVSTICTYPTASHPLRHSLQMLVILIKKHRDPATVYHEVRRWESILIIFVTVFVPMVVGMIFPNIVGILALTGATSTTCTSYLFPAMFYLILSRSEARKPLFDKSHLPVWALGIIGLSMGIISTIMVVIDLFIALPQE